MTNTIKSLIKTMNFRKLLIASIPLISFAILSVAFGASAECIVTTRDVACY